MSATTPPPPPPPEPAPPPPSPGGGVPAPPSRRNVWFIAALALGVLFAVTATAVVMLLRDRSDDTPGPTTTVATTVTTPVAPPSPGGPGELSPAKADVLGQLLESSEAEGVVVDEACLREVVARLSDDDARLLAELGIDDAEVSDQGDELAVELFGCIPGEWWLDEMARELESQGLTVDRACLEAELDDFDFRELGRAFREDGTPPEQLTTAGIRCSR